MEQNYLYSLTVFEDTDKMREDWRKKSMEALDGFEMQNQFGNGEQSNCIFLNQFQGKYLNIGIEHSLETHNVLLFVISNQTYQLGKILKESF